MKSLREYLNESTINEMGMRVKNANLAARDSINEIMLKEKYSLVYNDHTDRYDCKSNVIVDKELVKSDGTFKVKFGVIKGFFDCSNLKLTSLEGAPEEVGGDFNCKDNRLTSLEGAPKKVGGSFSCYKNSLIYNEKNFYGCLPDVIGGELEAGDGCDYELAKEYYNKK